MKLRHPHLFAIGLGLLLQFVAVSLLLLALNLQSPSEDWDGGGIAVFAPGTPDFLAADALMRAGASPSGPVWGGLAWGFFAGSPEAVERLRDGSAWLVAVSNPLGSLRLACGIAPLQAEPPPLSRYP